MCARDTPGRCCLLAAMRSCMPPSGAPTTAPESRTATLQRTSPLLLLSISQNYICTVSAESALSPTIHSTEARTHGHTAIAYASHATALCSISSTALLLDSTDFVICCLQRHHIALYSTMLSCGLATRAHTSAQPMHSTRFTQSSTIA